MREVPSARVPHWLLAAAVRVWLVETFIANINYFLFMQRVYQPRWGTLVAHQVGMMTRIAVIFLLAYLLLRSIKNYTTRDLIALGMLWVVLEEIFEWGAVFCLGARCTKS